MNVLGAPTVFDGSRKANARNLVRFGLFVCAGFLLGVTHLYLSSLSWQSTSPLFVLDRLFDLFLVGGVVLASLGIGTLILTQLGWSFESALAKFVFAFGIGSGLLSILLLLLGLAQLFYAPVVLVLLIAGVGFTQSQWRNAIRELHEIWRDHTPFSRLEKTLVVMLLLLIIPTLLAALTPPVDNDALSYHLVAPARFLQQHAALPAFDNIGLNYPIGLDLLYSFGLAAGSDIAAQLMHWMYACALTAGIYVFGARFFSRVTGILAMMIFWTFSAIGLEATTPIIDLAWAFYEFIALYAFFEWRNSRRAQYLILSGAAMGFALSNKYLAAVGAVILGSLVAYDSLRMFREQPRAVVKNLAILSASAFLICFPWYLKNAEWFGNPVYPFFTGSYGLDGQLRAQNGDLGGWVGLGLGNDLRAFVLFPWNVYANWQAFNFGFNRGGPSLFMLVLPFYFFVPKRSVINWLCLICVARFLFWWNYAQNMRYLVVIFPWLCLISAYVLIYWSARIQRPSLRVLLAATTAIFCLVGLVMQWGFLLVLRDGAVGFLSGQVSRDAFLEANLLDYRATRFMNEQLPTGARILAVGDARVYYLKQATIIDESHDNWLYIVQKEKTPQKISEYLHGLGVTHIWVSEDDLIYFRNNWKIDGPVKNQSSEFNALRDNYLSQVYADDRGFSVYALRNLSNR